MSEQTRDPADQDSMTGTLRLAFRKMMMGIDGMLPAMVLAVDGRTHVRVQPMIMLGMADGQKQSRAQIDRVPIFTFGAGGFLISMPVKEGDLGWILASDRDISLFMQALKEDWPHTKRLKSFSDGLFIPDTLRRWTFNGEDEGRLVIQSADGTQRLSIGDSGVKVTASRIDLDAATVAVSGKLTVGGDVEIAGVARAQDFIEG